MFRNETEGYIVVWIFSSCPSGERNVIPLLEMSSLEGSKVKSILMMLYVVSLSRQEKKEKSTEKTVDDEERCVCLVVDQK